MRPAEEARAYRSRGLGRLDGPERRTDGLIRSLVAGEVDLLRLGEPRLFEPCQELRSR